MLTINNLQVEVDGKVILHDINLTINAGETHAIMGPNGAGKSTLANVLVGRDNYQVTKGSIMYNGCDLLAWSPELRALNGIFLAFQYPVAIPGVSVVNFLKTCVNAKNKHQQLPELDAMDFLAKIKEKVKLLGIDNAMLSRSINDGFSGGEKKRAEILQMLLLEPQLTILDEPDSGLDIDALQTVAHGVNTLRSPKRSCLMITHYQRMLNYVTPDFVHVLTNGVIAASGGPELALSLEEKGYSWLKDSSDVDSVDEVI